MSEHTEQAALFEWAALYEGKEPRLRLLHAIPNGGKRDKGTAGKLKAAGVKAGVPDVFLPISRDGQHGFYLELKVFGGRASARQLEWGKLLTEQGYGWVLCYDWQIAAYSIIRYLGLNGDDFGLPWR